MMHLDDYHLSHLFSDMKLAHLTPLERHVKRDTGLPNDLVSIIHQYANEEEPTPKEARKAAIALIVQGDKASETIKSIAKRARVLDFGRCNVKIHGKGGFCSGGILPIAQKYFPQLHRYVHPKSLESDAFSYECVREKGYPDYIDGVNMAPDYYCLRFKPPKQLHTHPLDCMRSHFAHPFEFGDPDPDATTEEYIEINAMEGTARITQYGFLRIWNSVTEFSVS